MKSEKRPMSYAEVDALTRTLATPETTVLGEMLWFLLRAQSLMTDLTTRRIPVGPPAPSGFARYEDTDFGHEVGRDEIEWWINRKETDIPEFTRRVGNALKAAQYLKEVSLLLKKFEAETYTEIIWAFQDFAKRHLGAVVALCEFARWLYERDQLAPSILFTYKVWGSTRRGDRMYPLSPEATSPESEPADIMQTLTQSAWGFVSAGLSRYVRAELEIGADLYEDVMSSGQEPTEDIFVPESRVVRRAAREITDECAIFFEFIRNSLWDIEFELQARLSREDRLTSDRFWRAFIDKARKSPKAESTLWDFKETLSFWHVTESDAKRQEKQKLAADVASFANAEGGCLIVGVSDARRVVGVSNLPRDIENRLADIHQALEEHFLIRDRFIESSRSLCQMMREPSESAL